MTHSIQEISAKLSALPEPVQQEVFDFIEFMQIKIARQSSRAAGNRTALPKEQALAINLNRPEKDELLIIPRKAGALAGRIKISDDFNAPLADFAEYEQ